jgi:predicted SAM-dependent methyltransferase
VIKNIRNILTFFFDHRFLAITRWELHFLRIRLLNVITFQKARMRRVVARRDSPLFLNLGSGPRGVDKVNWINVDGFRDRNVHYLFDLSRSFPFRDESFDGVFCEHVLEHFSLEDGERITREILRILRPGGCVRIIVPDAELILRRYFLESKDMVRWRGTGNETPMEIVNSYFRQRYEHQFLYDWVTMEKMLVGAWLGAVVRTVFGKALKCPAIVLDDPKYEWESLYVEGSKGSMPEGL